MDTNQKLQKSLQKIAENSRELAKSIEDAIDAWENIERQMTFSDFEAENHEIVERLTENKVEMWTFKRKNGRVWKNVDGEIKLYSCLGDARQGWSYYKSIIDEADTWKIQKIYVDLNGAKL